MATACALAGAPLAATRATRARRGAVQVSAVAEVERAVPTQQRVRAPGRGRAPTRRGGRVGPRCRCRRPCQASQPACELCPGRPPSTCPPAIHATQRGVPEGTPVVPVRDLPSRPRRNRKSETVRRAFSETFLHPANFILPVFVHDGEDNIPIDSMPGVARLGWKTGLLDAVAEARSVGVNQARCAPRGGGHGGGRGAGNAGNAGNEGRQQSCLRRRRGHPPPAPRRHLARLPHPAPLPPCVSPAPPPAPRRW